MLGQPLGVHAPSPATLTPESRAKHSLMYVVPSTPQTGSKASLQPDSPVWHMPSLATSTPAAPATHSLLYVLPSTPQTGAYSMVQAASSAAASRMVSSFAVAGNVASDGLRMSRARSRVLSLSIDWWFGARFGS